VSKLRYKSGSRPASTLLEAVRASLVHAARYNPGDVVAPAAVLWTDADGQWRPVVEQLRTLMPELLTLGEFDPKTRTGPAICGEEGDGHKYINNAMKWRWSV